MKIENLERAVRAKDELEKLDKAISNLNKFKDNCGFLISEHTDQSGAFIDYQYVNGNYSPIYGDILKFTKQKFAEARAALVAEINSL